MNRYGSISRDGEDTESALFTDSVKLIGFRHVEMFYMAPVTVV